jgi:hypothetical protein
VSSDLYPKETLSLKECASKVREAGLGWRSNEIHLGCFEIVDGNEFVFVFSDEGNPPLVESFKLTVSGSPGLVDKIKAAGIRLGVD